MHNAAIRVKYSTARIINKFYIITVQTRLTISLCHPKLLFNGALCRLPHLNIKGKGKVVPAHAIKTYWGSGGIALLIPNLGTR
jgi:hypothetical protein